MTFTGEKFSENTSDYTILFDGVPCSDVSASETSVTCTTGERTGAFESDPELSMFISGVGYAAT